VTLGYFSSLRSIQHDPSYAGLRGVEPIPPTLFVVLVALVFTPLFFQLDGRIFTDPATLQAARGVVTNLPLPFSVLVCVVAVVALARRWMRDSLTLLLFLSVPLMFATSLVAGEGVMTWAKSKLLVFQFAVPLTGFMLGRQLGKEHASVQRAGCILLIVTGALALAQLTSTWFRRQAIVLSGDVYGVSIYDHLQYVPTIVIAAFLVGFFAAWDAGSPSRTRLAAVLLVPVMALYSAASMQFTAILALWIGLALFAASPQSVGRRTVAVLIVAVAVEFSSMYIVVALPRAAALQDKFLGSSAAGGFRRQDQVGRNMSERLYYWRYFAAGSLSDPRSFLFGHKTQPDIRLYPSAHNYYLDLLYNFGAIAMVPLAMLIAWSIRQVWAARAELTKSTALAGLLFATTFLVIVDNGMRVSMRQPYPGIATFFLWGMAVSSFSAPEASRRLARYRRSPEEPQQPVAGAVHDGIREKACRAKTENHGGRQDRGATEAARG
jgi:hypothetical protein